VAELRLPNSCRSDHLQRTSRGSAEKRVGLWTWEEGYLGDGRGWEATMQRRVKGGKRGV
jgi:hypothetical protein